MGTKYSSNATSGYNATPPADDGTVAEANKVKWSTTKTKLTDPVKDLADAINTDLVTHFDRGPTALTSNTTLGASHYNQFIQVSGSGVTLTLSDAATLTAGWFADIVNTDTTNLITLARATASNTIDATSSDVAIYPLRQLRVFVNAAANGFLTLANPNFGVMLYFIYGFTYQNNATDPTNDIDISLGGATDSTNSYFFTGTAKTKQSDVAWAVGTNAGGLDTGAVGNNDYYIWAIARPDTGVVDYLFSLSSTAPTMPTNYTRRRLIGWFKRVGGTIVAFHTYETEGGGLEFLWDSPTLDINLANTLTTTRRTDAVKVPLNFSVTALLNLYITDGASDCVAYIYCPDMTDLAPSNAVAPLGTLFSIAASGTSGHLLAQIRTSSTGTIAARSNVATTDSYLVSTLGFRWGRRN